MTAAPILYLSHGAPDLALSDHPARDFLRALGQRLPRPRGALVISAHFETPTLTLGTAPTPATWHDFHGFPAELYAVRYPARGLPQVATAIAETLGTAGHPVALDPARPLDHGIWSPLSLLWPDADVALIPVSVPLAVDTRTQLALGAALARAAADHDLILIGSGAATHNLGDRHPRHDTPDAWARDFQTWVLDVAARGDLASLARWREQAPNARHAHPTPEHFLPLLMCLGAAEGRGLTKLHDSFMYGNLSMLALGNGALTEMAETP
ncbi:class III extradiol ring-cleavage dioxygenase [Salinicola endophyticus]|uniref:Class III extradiol ring-cleavage dioxygenase n=1 Tax=Salinicola endophyticus TaxID=1949083 RepID=A0AB74U1E5_9GAMM